MHMGHVFAVRTCRARGSREFSVQPGMVCQGHRRVGGAHVCVQVFVVCRLRLYMVAPKRKLDGKACKFAMLSDIFGKVCRAGAAEPSSYKDLRDGKHRRPPLSASEAQRRLTGGLPGGVRELITVFSTAVARQDFLLKTLPEVELMQTYMRESCRKKRRRRTATIGRTTTLRCGRARGVTGPRT